MPGESTYSVDPIAQTQPNGTELVDLIDTSDHSLEVSNLISTPFEAKVWLI